MPNTGVILRNERVASAALRGLFDSNIVGVTLMDKAGRLLDANDEFLRILGYFREDLKSGRLTMSQIITPSRRGRDLLPAGSFQEFEKEYIHKDGSRVPVLVGGAVLDGIDGEFAGAAVRFILDLTERKKIEQQFHQAQKMEAVGLLAGGIAHDFNNLLGVMFILTEAVLEEAQVAGEAKANLVEKMVGIKRSCERAAALTRQLLAFSRRQVQELKVVDINEVVIDIDKMLRRLIGEDMVLTLELAPKLGRVLIDPTQLEQVILNLAVNARDAMPSGGKLRIRTRNDFVDESCRSRKLKLKVGEYVVLTVQDTGMGMDPAILNRIFEPFFTTKGPGKGTGLGLSTVFGIVKQSGGEIVVQSEQGVGSIFEIYLPRVASRRGKEKAERKLPAPRQGSERILLIEDEADLRSAISAALRRNGYDVVEARDGNEALAKHSRELNAFQLVITDVIMPGMTGPEFARRLISGGRADIKVLFLSGYSDDRLAQYGFSRIESHFLEKPFTIATLLGKVSEVMDKGFGRA
jgi:two-component system, cell cycle sensor histidine kinase and response regulator CckA